ncbi:alpha/beta hydrolase family protein [Nocardiopsis coralliicola]
MATHNSASAPAPLRHRRWAGHVTAAAVLAAGCAVPTASAAVLAPDPIRLDPPAPTGPHAVGQAAVHLVDEGRGHPWVPGADDRDLMVTLWYPAEPTGGERARYATPAVEEFLDGELEQAGLPSTAVDFAGSRTHAAIGAPPSADAGRMPVLLYSHGFAQTRHQATAQIEELASRGYAVAALDHPYESSAVELPDGRVLRGANNAGMEATPMYREAIATRVADAGFALDALDDAAGGGTGGARSGTAIPPEVAASLDLERVGMFGHSAGGLTAAEAMLADARIDAGVNLDASIAYHVGDEVWAAATVHGADRPFLLLRGGWSSGTGARTTSRESPDMRLFRENSAGPVSEVYLAEAEHMSFIDTQWMVPQLASGAGAGGPAWDTSVLASVGSIDPERSLAAQRRVLANFFDAELRGADQPLMEGVPSDAALIE